MIFNKPSLSIIIPCYNVEMTIDRCINSILASNFTDYEIILINDGSTDDTPAKINTLKALDNRIHSYTQINGGASSARNFGLNMAVGEWITFIDADDYIQPNYLYHFFESGNETGNLKIQGAVRHELSADIHLSFKQQETLDIDDEAIFYRHELLHFGYSWGKLYNLAIIKSNMLEFDEGIPYKEDLIFLLEYMKYCSAVTFLPYTDYIYVKNEGSLSNTWLPMEARQNIYNKIHKLLMTYVNDNHSELLSKYLCLYDTLCVREFLRTIYHPGKYKKKQRILHLKWVRKYININAYPHDFKADSLLSFLWRCRIFHPYDFIQRRLFKIHAGIN